MSTTLDNIVAFLNKYGKACRLTGLIPRGQRQDLQVDPVSEQDADAPPEDNQP